jgi:hypothetical protein
MDLGLSAPALLVALLLPLFSPPGAASAERTSSPDTLRAGPERAVWVWEADSFRLLDEEAGWGDFTSFLDRHGISTVYLYADSYQGRNILEDEPDRYRRFLRHLHERGLEVYALLGSKYLRTQEYVRPEKRAEAEAMLRRVLVYNREAEGREAFDGINIDVEPHLLDEWSSNRPELGRQFLDLSRRFVEMKEESAFQGPVGPAIPFWYDGIEVVEGGDAGSLSEGIQELYDYVAIMAYRDQAAGHDGIVRHVTNEVEHAEAHGKTVVVGVETKEGDLDKVTFHEETLEEMEEELTSVAERLADYDAFGGFAIHHYGSYRDWVSGR